MVKNAPLFSIDLVVLNEKREMLVGLRKNEPASGFWFVPGGRMYKGETIVEAFRRITEAELGNSFEREHFIMLGLYDHFYENSCFDESVSTHYINAPHLMLVDSTKLKLPLIQHDDYRWVPIEAVEADRTIHCFSKVFLSDLLSHLN
ncbi:NUDIX domain-containing protein [Shewanella decolorationis]|uniref:GDP-mannose mannosyl hydrolase n=1 Tax=Shewanella decolorationis TaxID=256839 RepID=UPI001AD8B8D0|nr:NUDIX domain-containing protein [Shewanella decolorationis]QDZ90389.4 NUDIX domain-containing protein [Shewanella decolorationis]